MTTTILPWKRQQTDSEPQWSAETEHFGTISVNDGIVTIDGRQIGPQHRDNQTAIEAVHAWHDACLRARITWDDVK